MRWRDKHILDFFEYICVHCHKIVLSTKGGGGNMMWVSITECTCFKKGQSGRAL